MTCMYLRAAQTAVATSIRARRQKALALVMQVVASLALVATLHLDMHAVGMATAALAMRVTARAAW